MSSEATEKEVLFSDERNGIHLSENEESSGRYVPYKLIVGGHIFGRKAEAVSRGKCCFERQLSEITRMLLWKTLRMVH